MKNREEGGKETRRDRLKEKARVRENPRRGNKERTGYYRVEIGRRE